MTTKSCRFLRKFKTGILMQAKQKATKKIVAFYAF